MPATLKDIARLAGVSTATASLALAGKYVNENTREKVLECAKQLNYVPNIAGRILVTGKSHAIEILIIHSRNHENLVLETSFFYYMLERILRFYDEHNYNIHYRVIYHEDEDILEYFQKRIQDGTIDGFIVLSFFTGVADYLSILNTLEFPYVVLNPQNRMECKNSVAIDNVAGGMLVAELFIKLGYRNIAFVNGPDNHIDAIARGKGFLKELKKNGIALARNAVFQGDFIMDSGYRGIKTILEEYKPEAVFCANDYMAAGVMRFLHQNQIKVPGDIAVVGYDNVDVASAIYPSLTTVDTMIGEVGTHLAELLHNLIKDDQYTGKKVLKPRLVIRESCPERISEYQSITSYQK